jgi:hypothetical protein
MAAQPFDGEMGLAGIGGAKDRGNPACRGGWYRQLWPRRQILMGEGGDSAKCGLDVRVVKLGLLIASFVPRRLERRIARNRGRFK